MVDIIAPDQDKQAVKIQQSGLLRAKKFEINASQAKNEPLLSLEYLDKFLKGVFQTFTSGNNVENPAPKVLVFTAGSESLNKNDYLVQLGVLKEKEVEQGENKLKATLYLDDLISVITTTRNWLESHYGKKYSLKWQVEAEVLTSLLKAAKDELDDTSGLLTKTYLSDLSREVKDALEDLLGYISAILNDNQEELQLDSNQELLRQIKQDALKTWEDELAELVKLLAQAQLDANHLTTPNFNLSPHDLREVLNVFLEELSRQLERSQDQWNKLSDSTKNSLRLLQKPFDTTALNQNLINFTDIRVATNIQELLEKILEELEKKAEKETDPQAEEKEEDDAGGGETEDKKPEKLPEQPNIDQILSQIEFEAVELVQKQILQADEVKDLSESAQNELGMRLKELVIDYFSDSQHRQLITQQIDQYLIETGLQKKTTTEGFLVYFIPDEIDEVNLNIPNLCTKLALHYSAEFFKLNNSKIAELFQEIKAKDAVAVSAAETEEAAPQAEETQVAVVPATPAGTAVVDGNRLAELVELYRNAKNENQVEVLTSEAIRAGLLTSEQEKVFKIVQQQLFAVMPFDLINDDLRQMMLEIAVTYALEHPDPKLISQSTILFEIFAKNQEFRQVVERFYSQNLNQILSRAKTDEKTGAQLNEFLFTSTVLSDDWVANLTDQQLKEYFNISNLSAGDRAKFLLLLKMGLYLKRFDHYKINLPHQGVIDAGIFNRDSRGEDGLSFPHFNQKVHAHGPAGLLAIAGEPEQLAAQDQTTQNQALGFRQQMLISLWQSLPAEDRQVFLEYYLPDFDLSSENTEPYQVAQASGVLPQTVAAKIAPRFSLGKLLGDIHSGRLSGLKGMGQNPSQEVKDRVAKALLEKVATAYVGVAAKAVVRKLYPILKKIEEISKKILPLIGLAISYLFYKFPIFMGTIAAGIGLSVAFPFLAPIILPASFVAGGLLQWGATKLSGLWSGVKDILGFGGGAGGVGGGAALGATAPPSVGAGVSLLPTTPIVPAIIAASAGTILMAQTILTPGAFLHNLDYSASIIETYGLCWPTTGNITTYKRYPGGAPHAVYGGIGDAVDIANAEGTPIISPFSGTIVLAGAGQDTMADYGNYVMMTVDETINGHTGFTVIFAHLSKVADKFHNQTGKKVEKGDEIGLMGTTGNSSGPHLHYEVVYRDGSGRIITIPEVAPPQPEIQLTSNGFLISTPVITKRCVGSYLAQDLGALSCEEPIKIMPVGDSITVGMGAEGQGGYRGPLYQKLTSLGHNNIQFVGTSTQGSAIPAPEGGGGEKHHEGYENQNPAAIFSLSQNGISQLKPDITLIHAGTIDICNSSPNEYAANVLDIAQHAENNGSKVFVAKIIGDNQCGGSLENHEAFNQALVSIYQQRQADDKLSNTAIIDLSQALSLDNDYTDGVHPNSAGYIKMADGWYNQALVDLPKCR